MNELVLPWPDRRLSPNARTHWRSLASVKRAARHLAAALAIQSRWNHVELPDGRLHLWMDFYPPDRRRRDDDNCFASTKAYRDGIADALGIDDSRFVSHPHLRDEVRRGGEIRVRITEGLST